jgi:hypothetical protein
MPNVPGLCTIVVVWKVFDGKRAVYFLLDANMTKAVRVRGEGAKMTRAVRGHLARSKS